MKTILMGTMALMLVCAGSFASDKTKTAKKAPAKQECKTTNCKDKKECKDKTSCPPVCKTTCAG